MSDARVAIITALETEARPIMRRLGLSRDRTGGPCVGRLDECDVTLLITGVGPDHARQATRRLLAAKRFDRVIIAGLCGAMNPLMRSGELVWPNVLIDGVTHHVYERPIQHERTGRHISVAALVATPQAKATLFARHAVDTVDMESAAIASVCHEHDTPWLCLRAVGDEADEGLPEYLGELVDVEGRARPWPTIKRLAGAPMQVGTFMRLARQTRRATAVLAEGAARLLDGWFCAAGERPIESTADGQAPLPDRR